MTILYVKPKPGQETGIGEKGSQRFRTGYTVKSNIVNESRSAILASELLPQYGYGHPQNLSAICSAVDVRQSTENPYLWDVWAEWTTTTRDQNDPREDQKQPDQRRPKWRMNFVEVPQSWFRDLDGLRFADTAGSLFSPPPDSPIFVDEVVITRYEVALNRTWDRNYLNATNTDTWNGAVANTALVKNISTDEVFEWGAYWFLRTYTILISPKILVPASHALTTDNGSVYQGGWYPSYYLNAGPKSLVTVGETKIAKPHVDLGIVDGAAQPLKPDGSLVERNETTGLLEYPLYYLAFRTVQRVAFAPLGLIPPWN